MCLLTKNKTKRNENIVWLTDVKFSEEYFNFFMMLISPVPMPFEVINMFITYKAKVETGRFIVETLFNYITFFILLMRFRLYQSALSYDRQEDMARVHLHQISDEDKG